MSHGRLLPVLVLAIVTLFLQTPVCYGENETEVEFTPYTLRDESSAVLTMHGGQIWPGDEYISGDDKWYRVVSVDDAARTATAEYLGDAGDDALTAFAVNQADSRDGKKLIAMYSTHSDESYVRSGASTRCIPRRPSSPTTPTPTPAPAARPRSC